MMSIISSGIAVVNHSQNICASISVSTYISFTCLFFSEKSRLADPPQASHPANHPINHPANHQTNLPPHPVVGRPINNHQRPKRASIPNWAPSARQPAFAICPRLMAGKNQRRPQGKMAPNSTGRPNKMAEYTRRTRRRKQMRMRRRMAGVGEQVLRREVVGDRSRAPWMNWSRLKRRKRTEKCVL